MGPGVTGRGVGGWVALAAVVAAAGAMAWSARREAPESAAGPAEAPTGSRSAVLDELEAAEASSLGAEEAARRRHRRERMLDLRAHDH